MKKIALALATLGMAAMFTACGDDSSSSGGKVISCDVKTEMEFLGIKMSTHTCGEAVSTSANVADLNEGCVSVEEFGVTATKGDGCPSGEVKKCEGDGVTSYFYDDDAKGMDCEKLMANDDEDEDAEAPVEE